MGWHSSPQCTELMPPMDDFSNSLSGFYAPPSDCGWCRTGSAGGGRVAPGGRSWEGRTGSTHVARAAEGARANTAAALQCRSRVDALSMTFGHVLFAGMTSP